jgi:hypothetical protein
MFSERKVETRVGCAGEGNSCPGDAPDDFCVDATDESPDLAGRTGMWQQKQFLLVQLAPGAAVPIAQFDKINGPFILTRPATAQDLSRGRIDLYE